MVEIFFNLIAWFGYSVIHLNTVYTSSWCYWNSHDKIFTYVLSLLVCVCVCVKSFSLNSHLLLFLLFCREFKNISFLHVRLYVLTWKVIDIFHNKSMNHIAWRENCFLFSSFPVQCVSLLFGAQIYYYKVYPFSFSFFHCKRKHSHKCIKRRMNDTPE